MGILVHEMGLGDSIQLTDEAGHEIARLEPQYKRGRKVFRLSIQAPENVKILKEKAHATAAKPATYQTVSLAGVR